MISRNKVSVSDLKYIQSQIQKILNLQKYTQLNGNGKTTSQQSFMKSTQSFEKKNFISGNKYRTKSMYHQDNQKNTNGRQNDKVKKNENKKSQNKPTGNKTPSKSKSQGKSKKSKKVSYGEPSVKLNNNEIKFSDFGKYQHVQQSKFVNQPTPRSKRSDSMKLANNSIIQQSNKSNKIGQLSPSLLQKWNNGQTTVFNKVENKRQEKVQSPIYRNNTEDISLSISRMKQKSPDSSITSRQFQSSSQSCVLYKAKTPDKIPQYMGRTNKSPLRTKEQLQMKKYAYKKHTYNEERQKQLKMKYHVLDQRLNKLRNQVRINRVGPVDTSPLERQKEQKKRKAMKQLKLYERYSPLKKLLNYSQKKQKEAPSKSSSFSRTFIF